MQQQIGAGPQGTRYILSPRPTGQPRSLFTVTYGVWVFGHDWLPFRAAIVMNVVIDIQQVLWAKAVVKGSNNI